VSALGEKTLARVRALLGLPDGTQPEVEAPELPADGVSTFMLTGSITATVYEFATNAAANDAAKALPAATSDESRRTVVNGGLLLALRGSAGDEQTLRSLGSRFAGRE
jgi:hypothetical protein